MLEHQGETVPTFGSIVVLSGFPIWNPRLQKWASCPLIIDQSVAGGDDFKGGFTFCEVRPAAAAILHLSHPCPILTTGRDVNDVLGNIKKRFDAPDAPSIAEILRQELIDAGVEEEYIYAMTEVAYNTKEQLIYLCKNLGRFPKPILLTNRYHCARVAAMIMLVPELAPLRGVAQVTSAEDFLLECVPDLWADRIAAAYQSERMSSRIDSEWGGIRALLEGSNYISRVESVS